jgi:hypothetical protein
VSSRRPTASAKTFAAERLQSSTTSPALVRPIANTPPSQTVVAWRSKRVWLTYTDIPTQTRPTPHAMNLTARRSLTREPSGMVTRPEWVQGQVTCVPGKTIRHSYGRGDDVNGGVGRGTSGYGTDDGYGHPGAQNFERQQSPIDGNGEMGPDPSGKGTLSPNRGPPNAESEVSRPSRFSQAAVLTPTQQMMKRGPPPGLPPRPQAQATDQTT